MLSLIMGKMHTWQQRKIQSYGTISQLLENASKVCVRITDSAERRSTVQALLYELHTHAYGPYHVRNTTSPTT
jgi:hypothetical protein